MKTTIATTTVSSDDRHDVGAIDAEDAAEQRRVEAAAAPAEDGEQREPERERGGRDHADRGVGADHSPARDAVDHQCRRDTPHAGTEHEVDAEQRARREAAEDRVRQAVTDVAHALQHDVHADQPAQRAGDGRDDQAVAEELELERAQQSIDHDAFRSQRDERCRDGASSGRARSACPACSRISIGAPNVRSSMSAVSTWRGVPWRDDHRVEAHEVRQMRGHAVEVVRRQHDRRARRGSAPRAGAAPRDVCGHRHPRSARPSAAAADRPSSARATKTRCCWPPDSSRMCRSARSPIPSRASMSCIALRSSRLGHGSIRPRVRAISTHSRNGHREVPVDRLHLRHVADAKPVACDERCRGAGRCFPAAP